MKIGKKLITYVLVLTICFSMFGSFGITAHAATTRYYSTMDAIPEDLAIFETMQKGTISAVNVSGVWYYQFARSGYDTIRVKLTAFLSTSHTNAYLAADNAFLTNVANKVSSSGNDGRWNYYVVTKKRTYNQQFTSGASPVPVDEYTTSRWRSRLDVSVGTADKIILRATLHNYVQFTLKSHICVHHYGTPYFTGPEHSCWGSLKIPKNATELVWALDRTSVVDKINPIMELSITDTGNLGAYLSTYRVSGKGNATPGIKFPKLISLGYKTVKLAIETTPSNLLSLVIDMASLSKATSDTYNTGNYIFLTSGNNFAYKVKYVSPINLVKLYDYVLVDTDIANIKSDLSGRGTAKFKVVFSFK